MRPQLAGVHQVLVHATAQIQIINTLHVRHLGLHLPGGWVGEVVLDPAGLVLGLIDDGLQQPATINARNVLHPCPNFGWVATESPVSALMRHKRRIAAHIGHYG